MVKLMSSNRFKFKKNQFNLFSVDKLYLKKEDKIAPRIATMTCGSLGFTNLKNLQYTMKRCLIICLI